MKKGREGPGRCSLCKLEDETNFHLGVEYPFTQSVWLNIEEKLRIKNLWSGDSIINCMKTWCLNMEVKNIISLPIIVLWFIWKPEIRVVSRTTLYYLLKHLFSVWVC